MLVLSLLLASLTACGAQAKKPDEPETPQADQAEPSQPGAPAEPAPQDPEPIADVQPIAEPEPISAVEPEPEPASVNPLTFADCNETVYATGNVNLRSGPSTDYEKVGSMGTGESVTRTGIGTGDYSSWSRVMLNDGAIVYVSSNYISTNKPVVQQATKPSTATTASKPSTPSGGTSNNNGGEAGGEEFIESLGLDPLFSEPFPEGEGGLHHNPNA